MNIGIIGAGALGSNAARLLVESGVSATIANSRGPQSLSRLVGELGPSVKAGSVEEAASADMVLVAVRWVDLEKALGGFACVERSDCDRRHKSCRIPGPCLTRREGPDQSAGCLWHQGN